MNVRAIILAAGASTRMGRPKALLEFRGKTFLDGLLDTFLAAGVQEIAVVAGGEHAASCRAVCERRAIPAVRAAIRVVENPHPERGQWSSVRAGLDAAGRMLAEAYAVQPVDIPGVRASDVRALIARLEAEPAALVAIPSVDSRRAHPILLRRSLALRASSLGADATLRDLIDLGGDHLAYVTLDNPLLRHDVDTEDDYQELLRLASTLLSASTD